jgi:hypothetical protein
MAIRAYCKKCGTEYWGSSVWKKNGQVVPPPIDAHEKDYQTYGKCLKCRTEQLLRIKNG